MAHNIGTASSVYIADYDLKGRCPHCNSENISIIGTLHINNVPQTSYHCKSCNKGFSGHTGGIQKLIDEAAIVSGTSSDNIGFTISNIGMPITSTDSATAGYGLTKSETSISIDPNLFNTYNIEYRIDNTNSHLQQLQYKLDNLNSTIWTLVNKIEELARKNTELQSDPLIGLKKKIIDFNLQ